MALLDFWKSSQETVLTLSIQQIVGNAGDGKLRDQSDCSIELRAFLRQVPSEHLARYTQSCLDEAFTDSGLVLQDLVNEVGRRLEFEVEDGLYRGRKNSIGFDGIWRSDTTPDIVIEVKTTDYVTVQLEKIVSYKTRLVHEGRLSGDASILIVVGREDTGALEAQIRGSRFAWDMRLISADRLSTLLRIKERSNEDATVRQIKELLRPFEYTKIDQIIDVIFATAEDVETEVVVEAEAANDVTPGGAQVRTDRALLNARRVEAAEAIAKKRGLSLQRYRQTLFWTPDEKVRVCVAVSKRYEGDYQPYWYAYLPKWDEFLSGGEEGFFVLACMDQRTAYVLPWELVHSNLDNLNQSKSPGFWHIALNLSDGEIFWNISKIGKKVPLAPYAIELPEASAL